MSPYPFRAISFDLDQTLLDGGHFQQAIATTCTLVAEKIPSIDAKALHQANGQSFQNQIDTTLKSWTLGQISGRDLSREIWQQTFSDLGHQDEALIEFATETLEALARQSYQLFSDVLPVLSRLRDQQIPIALLTNGSSDTQRTKLESLEIEDLFDVVIISGEHRVAKPDPRIFEQLSPLGPDLTEIWHVGDMLETDVLGAQQAGLGSVWLNRHAAVNDKQIRPDHEISTLSDLL